MATKRQRQLTRAVTATVVGIVAVAALASWRALREDTDLADPTAGVTAEFQHAARSSEGPGDLVLRDVAREVGVSFRHGPGDRSRKLTEDTGSGLCWGDYDDDGDDDLYLVNFGVRAGGAAGANRLFRNDLTSTGSRFVNVTDQAGVGDQGGFGMGASFADFDDDGDLDLYVTNFGPNRLFANRGDGTFEEVAQALGVAGAEWSVAAVWGDLDRDGRLDLYVTNYVDYDAAAAEIVADDAWQGVPFTLNPNSFDAVPNRLYRQLSGGGFEEIGLLAGVDNGGGRSLAATVVDLDGDGWLDLYVANDVSPNALFRNRTGEAGALLFDDWSALTGTADERGSMGISVADLAGEDSLPDLFVSHWIAQENALYVATRAPSGRLEYRDRVRQFRLGEISTDRVGWGTAVADLDLDGLPELLVANGSTLENAALELEAQPPFVFWNQGDRFLDVTAGLGADVAAPRVARGLAVADYDLDGDVDVAVSVNRGDAVLWQTGGVAASWAGVRFDSPSAWALGTVVTATSDGRSQTRFLGADVSFASGHSWTQTFGLGAAERVEVTLQAPGRARRALRALPTSRQLVVRPW